MKLISPVRKVTLAMGKLVSLLELVAGFFFVVLLALIVPARENRSEQPLPFNHKKHVEAGWECINCHPFADHAEHAGIPQAQECVECHEAEMPKYPDNKEMRETTELLKKEYIAKGREIPWKVVHRLHDWVYFSHQRHVNLGKIQCTECHVGVDKMTEPVSRSLFPIPSYPKMFAYNESVRKMQWCVDCHEQKNVTTDCNACHR